MKRASFILFLMILLACGSARLMTPTQTDVDRGAQTFPGMTLSDLENGKRLFERHCHSCHPLKKPTSRSEEKWREVVPVMVKRVNKKAGHIVIDDTGEQQVLQYVVTMSTAKR